MAAVTSTGGTMVTSVAMTACCAVPPLSLRSTARAYWTKKCSTAARHWKARHFSRLSAARIAMTFNGLPSALRAAGQFALGSGPSRSLDYPSRSCLQLLPVAKLLERLRIGERFDVLDRQAMHDVAHGQLDDLVALGAGNVSHLHDFRRHVPRCRVRAHLLLDAIGELLVDHHAVL